MRELFYLLTLTFCCLLKNGYCSFEEFKSNTVVKRLLQRYYNEQISGNELLTAVNNIEGLEMNLNINLLKHYLHLIKKAGGGSRNYITFDQFINNELAMSLVRKYKDEQNKEIRTQQELLKELKKIGFKMSKNTLTKYLDTDFDATAHLPNQSQSTEMLDFSNTAPFPQAPQIAQQSFNFTSGNPGSSTSAVNKGKSINFSKNSGNWPLSSITGASSHYGDAMPFQQVPPMDDTFVPFQAGTDSTNWFEEMQSNDGDLYSVVRPKNTSSSKGFDGTPFLPNQSQSTEFWDFSNPAPPSSQAPQIAQQSSNFTSGNPGSSTSASEKGKSTNFSSALNKGKSTNFSKKNPGNWSLSSITGLASHYGDAMPSQQVPPMDDIFGPSQVGNDSTDWFGENLQSNDGDLASVVRPKNTSLFKRALGFVSNLVGASPQEPQFSPSIHDTAAASSYYPSNQPDDGTLGSMITPRNQKDSSSYYGSAMPYQQVPPVQDTFVPSQTGTDSTNFFGGNLQNNDGDLASVIRKPSSSKGFYGTPFLPNQSQSTGWPGTSNFFSPTPNTSNFTSGNPGSSTYYGSAIPSQQAPMPGTSFPSFPNYPSNQSAQLNSSTNFVPSQPGTPSLDWSGGNSQNNEGDLYSMFNTRKPRSEKKGKKPRK